MIITGFVFQPRKKFRGGQPIIVLRPGVFGMDGRRSFRRGLLDKDTDMMASKFKILSL